VNRKSVTVAPRLIAVAWPLFVEMVLGFAVGLLGLWLASRESDAAASAFAMANQLQAVFFLLFRVISMGVSVVITQNLGAANRVGADATARAALGASTWLGMTVAVLVVLGAGRMLALLQAPPEVLALGQPYLRMLALGLALDAFNSSMAAVMRAHMHARDTMLTILVMHVILLLLCLPLMRGWGLMPGLDLQGFALALGISRAVGLGIHLLLWRWRLSLIPHMRDWWQLQWTTLRPVLHIGLPGAAENVAYRMAMLGSITVVAGMGAQALATQTYTFQLMNLIVLFGVSMGFACEILIGHLIGAGQLRAANRLLRKTLVWGLGVSFGIALLTAATAPWTLRVFTQDARIISMGTTLLWITVLLEPGRTCNVVIINALRATGDARFPVFAGAVSMLLVMAGGSWLLGVYFELGLVGVWIAYAADECLRGLAMAARWFGRGWVPAAKNVHRSVARQGRTSFAR
jgi:putative MATE family efflux protein